MSDTTIKQQAILMDMEIASRFYEGEELVKKCREIILAYREDEEFKKEQQA